MKVSHFVLFNVETEQSSIMFSVTEMALTDDVWQMFAKMW